ncbi:MAG: FUSC family protein [Microbacteriaceae bacterium]
MDDLGTSPQLTVPHQGKRSKLLASAQGALLWVVSGERLLLTLKTTLAATAAWFLGRLMPEPLNEYSYYAPFGAVLAMAPTVVASLRSTLQTVIGVALGIGTAWGLLLVGAPGFISVPAAVAVGTLIAGFLRPGPGRDYIPVAALFVLIIGGRDAEDFSTGYLVQIALGMLVGVIVTVAVVAPLNTSEAKRSMQQSRDTVSEYLRMLAKGSAEPGGEDIQAVPGSARFKQSLDLAVAQIDHARESRRGNPRAQRERHDLSRDDDDLSSLRRITRHGDDLAELLGAEGDETPLLQAPEAVREAMPPALDALADLVDAWNSGEEVETASSAALERIQAVQARVDDWMTDVAEAGDLDAEDTEWRRQASAAVVVAMHRIRTTVVRRAVDAPVLADD